MQPAYDVAVVGGGPAGAMAALAAAEAGASTVLLERAAVPRYKTCGGGLTAVSLAALPAGFTPPARATASTIGFTSRGRRACERDTGTDLVTLVDRADLDAALLDVAAAAGAEVRASCTVVAVADEGEAVVLSLADGTALRARAVVGADGSSGRLSRHVGVELDHVDVGLEVELPTPAHLRSHWEHRLQIDWGPLPGSYGWVFPKGGRLSVGVIGDRGQGPALRDYLADLLCGLGLAGVEPEVSSGHLTRCRTPGSPLHRGRVLLAGDAAGLLEPLMREGISFALRSGRLAGVAAAAGTGQAFAAYDDAVLATLGAEMAAGGALLAAFTRRPGAFHAGAWTPVGWRLFRRFVEGRTTLPALMAHRGVPRLTRLLAR